MLLLQSHLAVVCANHFQNFIAKQLLKVEYLLLIPHMSFLLLNISKAINLSFMFLQERVSMIEVRNR
jgi:hypothetical protein